MILMRISFTASQSPVAQDALTELSARYASNVTTPEEADVIVALGGDGFMLETLHQHGRSEVPVYGMNRGTVGFLMNTYDATDLPARIEAARNQEIAPLHVNARNTSGKVFEASAINEVSLLRQGPQAAHLRILVEDRERLDRLVCDGAMLSTPAGSTAYNLSAGGPILPIGANVLALTPLAAFRPRRWRGALLPVGALVRFETLDAEKRPVMVSADSVSFSDIASVEVALETRFSHHVLFDPDHNLDDRILNEQFC
jgi:NAD+ kinase